MATNSSALLIPPPPDATTAALTNDIRAIKPPVPVPNDWAWVAWVLGLLALLVLGVWLWDWWRRKRLRILPVPVIPPHVRARQKLQAALAFIHDAREFCIRISEALRVYLEERFDFHAPERTTEEFLLELHGSRLLLPDQKQSLADFLQSCDLVKFARHEPSETALHDLHEHALRLIHETQFEPIDGNGAPGAPPSRPSHAPLPPASPPLAGVGVEVPPGPQHQPR